MRLHGIRTCNTLTHACVSPRFLHARVLCTSRMRAAAKISAEDTRVFPLSFFLFSFVQPPLKVARGGEQTRKGARRSLGVFLREAPLSRALCALLGTSVRATFADPRRPISGRVERVRSFAVSRSRRKSESGNQENGAILVAGANARIQSLTNEEGWGGG